MSPENFMQLVENAARRMGYRDPVWLALLMAAVEQESVTAKGPTHLAFHFNNLGGVKWLPGNDEGRYEKIGFPGNQFEDPDEKVWYRIYESREHSLENIRWHFLNSSLYSPARRAFFRKLGEIMPGGKDVHDVAVIEGKALADKLSFRADATRAFIDEPNYPGSEMAKVWCSVNPTHALEVMSKFEKWLKRYA